MKSFNDFVHKYSLKNKASSNIKVYEVFNNVGLEPKLGIYLRGGDLSTNYGIVNLHPSRRTHWVAFLNENYFGSFGCSPPRKLYKFIIKRNGHCFYLQYKIQRLAKKRDYY